MFPFISCHPCHSSILSNTVAHLFCPGHSFRGHSALLFSQFPLLHISFSVTIAVCFSSVRPLNLKVPPCSTLSHFPSPHSSPSPLISCMSKSRQLLILHAQLWLSSYFLSHSSNEHSVVLLGHIQIKALFFIPKSALPPEILVSPLQTFVSSNPRSRLLAKWSFYQH